MATQTQTDTVSKKLQYIWPCANTYYREPRWWNVPRACGFGMSKAVPTWTSLAACLP